MDFILLILPVILLISSVLGLLFSLKYRKGGLTFAFLVCLVGVATHYVGLFVVGGFEGMGVSMLGAGIFLFGLLILLILTIVHYIQKLTTKTEMD